ncbi:MAG: hypothetical protein KF819_12050 [Labilithrix sp.]|nr:hypothetical protein [Labilithrix sp.]
MPDRLTRLEPRRRIIHGDALAWMDANEAEEGTSVITSLPDLSEGFGSGAPAFERWRDWFVGAARRVLRWVPPSGVAIFFQSDIRKAGTWVDKGYLVMRAGEEESASLLWHKIVCRKPAGTLSLGRASYSHMLCFTRGAPSVPTRLAADVLPDAGAMGWSRAMGVEACRAACRFLVDETATRTVVDPFCGKGTALAVANAMGLDAIGVELSAKRCRAARALVVTLAALALAGCAPVPAAPPASAPPIEVPMLALQRDHVRRLRDAEAAAKRGTPERYALARRLAGALLDLSAEHRRLAVASDPKAASLPAPPDLRAPQVDRDPNAAELDVPSEGERRDLRDEASLAALSPVARAHVREADRHALDACVLLAEVAHVHGVSDWRASFALRARVLAELGQRHEAAGDFYAVLKAGDRDALAVEAWLFFATKLLADGRSNEAREAFIKARAAADGELAGAVCAKASGAGVEGVEGC